MKTEMINKLEVDYKDEAALLALINKVNKSADFNLGTTKGKSDVNAKQLMGQTKESLIIAAGLFGGCLSNSPEVYRAEATTYLNLAVVHKRLGLNSRPYIQQAKNALCEIPSAERNDEDRAKIQSCKELLPAVGFFKSVKIFLSQQDKKGYTRRLRK